MQLIIAGSFLILLLVLLVDAFLAQLPAEYQGAKWVVLLLASSKLIDMATSINGEIIQTSKYYKFNLYLIVALMIFTIFANAYFIPRYGIIGAALATTMVNVLFNVAKYLYVWFKVRIQPFTIGIVWVLLMSTIIAFALIWLTQGMNIWWSAFLRFSLASVAFIVFLLMSRVSPEIHGIWVKQVLPRLGFKNK
jgi:O-antigen/teichoic acid export membrane protein